MSEFLMNRSNHTVRKYVCKDSETIESSLTIAQVNEGLSFTSLPKSQIVRHGDVAKFTCTVSGTPPVYVYWFKEGDEDADSLTTDEKYELSCEGDNYCLEIFYVTAEDAGQYMCVARSETETNHSFFLLTVDESVDYEQKEPLFLKELSDIEVTEGEVVKFRCKVRAYPLPRVSWYKDGERINHSRQYQLEKFGNRDYSLTITGVTPEHGAKFTVVAKNGAGESESSAQLHVEAAQNKKRQYVRRRESSRARLYGLHGENMEHTAPAKQPVCGRSIKRSASLSRKPLTLLQSETSKVSRITSTKARPEELTQKCDTSEKEADSFYPVEGEVKPKYRHVVQSVSARHNNNQSVNIPNKKPLSAAQLGVPTSSPADKLDTSVSMRPTLTVEREIEKEAKQVTGTKRHMAMVQLANVTTPNSATSFSATSFSASLPTNSSSPNTFLTTKQSVQEGSETRVQQPTNPNRPPLQYSGLGNQKSPATNQKGKIAANSVDIPRTLELVGSCQKQEVPPSRSEWSVIFPSVKQRKSSFSREDKPKIALVPKRASSFHVSKPNRNSSPHCQTQRSDQHTPSSARDKLTTDQHEPSLPHNSQHNFSNNSSSSQIAKEDSYRPVNTKLVKKLVKKVITQVSSTDSSSEPPKDGQYIKVCGKWVRLKGKSKLENVATKSEPNNGDQKIIPVSRLEWVPAVTIEKPVKSSTKSRDSKRAIITRRNLGPVTAV